MKPEMPTWQMPPSRSYAALSDCGLYAEVLQVAEKEPFVSPARLTSEEEGLRQRMRRLHLVQFPTKANITALVNAMQEFGWVAEHPGSRGQFAITKEGREVARECSLNPRAFRRRLAIELHKRYVIPGWFVSRLYAINPLGEGEVVLPAPPKSEKTERFAWTRNEWQEEYEEVALRSARSANESFPGSFPVPMDHWISEIKRTWNYLGSLNPPVPRKKRGRPEKRRVATFGTRERLMHAMREAAINLLFGAKLADAAPDFTSSKPPVPPRAFRVWCPRLEELELIFYTDYHPSVSGRLMVPCSAFRYSAKSPPFVSLDTIYDPQQRQLWLYQPRWEDVKGQFLKVLLDTYRRLSKKVGAMYVSLLNVRDEVCRRLRLSSEGFDGLLDHAYRDTIRSSLFGSKFISISLETDITDEQKGAVGLNRRPVYINAVPHSLIAMAVVRGK
jgi:hypothetical protein